MTPEELSIALAGARFSDLRVVGVTGSTNADLMAAARAGGGEQAMVADHQRAGRGRLDRSWEAPPGSSLLMSVLIRPPFPTGGAHFVAIALGLAAVEAVQQLSGSDVALKWPNDLVAPAPDAEAVDRKLGGLLAELHTGAGGDAVVAGIGINLSRPGGFPPELAATATAVDRLGGSVDRDELAVAVLRGLDRLDELTDPAGCTALIERYRRRCITLGRPVRVERSADELVGTATDVDATGALLVRDDLGAEHVVTVGDVVHLRPR